MLFQLWEMSSGNMVDAFTTKREALAFIRGAIDAHGRDYVETWALAYEDDDGTITSIASGESLADIALDPAAA